MSLPRRLADQFPPAVQARGEAYYRGGAVTLVRVTPSQIDAVVQGTLRYDVTIRRVSTVAGSFRCSCTCPYATDIGDCKHMWATLRQASETVGLPVVVSENDDDDDNEDLFPLPPARAPGGRPQVPPPPPPRPPPVPTWKTQLAGLRGLITQGSSRGVSKRKPWPADRRLLYIVDLAPSIAGQLGLIIELATETRSRDGEWVNLKPGSLSRDQWLNAADPDDREIAQMLAGAREEFTYYRASHPRRFVLDPPGFETTLRRMCATGRCRVKLADTGIQAEPLRWDEGPPWEFRLAVTARDGGALCRLEGLLVRGDERLPFSEHPIYTTGSHVIVKNTVARFSDHNAPSLALALQTRLTVDVPRDDAGELLAELSTIPRLPPLDLADALKVEQVRAAPTPRIALRPSPPLSSGVKVDGHLSFAYDGTVVGAGHSATVLFDRETRRMIHRDRAAEDAFAEQLRAVGFKREYDYGARVHVERLLQSKVPAVALALSAQGWYVESDGQPIRRADAFDLSVRSSIDWFDLEGGVSFGALRVTLPELLAAVRRGERTITLGDGSIGILPDEWLGRAGALAMVAQTTDGQLRFAKVQIGVLDALLATMPAATTDAVFARARAELHRFEGIAPASPPATFIGELRAYQAEGLGWLEFLRRFGFGGCLADDMGLGKTVQALAQLESRREAGAGPSLIVVPRSLVFNWEREAARFAPRMRVLVHAGTQRVREPAALQEYDLILTTYGTLRRDAVWLREVAFEYVVLDEAQMIKNPTTESAKAARLLQGRHRLAMSGTPVENRLSDLWSMFEFLNPGMLGAAAAFKRLTKISAGEDPDVDVTDAHALIARAVRPFILRRTKQQVAHDLPEKLEQTLLVDLSAAERKLYDELRDHYRALLLDRIARDGIAKSKIHVLEALLRLRQAACHPGLIDKTRADVPSSKLEVLIARLGEVVAEGHKAVVFSQFTSFLAIARQQLDAEGIAYEYLDGRTRDRAARVDRFQADAGCNVFLVSLKAGGLGLNLTAAEYVFLLDPWWNPAVESQAIDRAHRIGQTRRVFATRLIARDTVEEKVIELQAGKRALADAIVRADDGLIAKLRREDLELLLA